MMQIQVITRVLSYVLLAKISNDRFGFIKTKLEVHIK